MTSTLPVNMQQVFQMWTYTEKLQHTILTTPNVTAQQEDKKRIQDDDLKHSQVQIINLDHSIENINHQNQSKKRDSGVMQSQIDDEEHNSQLSLPEPPLPELFFPEDSRLGKINIVV